jgi:hypothetical protein
MMGMGTNLCDKLMTTPSHLRYLMSKVHFCDSS